jgi:hypothetical protein
MTFGKSRLDRQSRKVKREKLWRLSKESRTAIASIQKASDSVYNYYKNLDERGERGKVRFLRDFVCPRCGYKIRDFERKKEMRSKYVKMRSDFWKISDLEEEKTREVEDWKEMIESTEVPLRRLKRKQEESDFDTGEELKRLRERRKASFGRLKEMQEKLKSFKFE